MTTAELGRQLKEVHHPHYADVPDHILGAALKSKYPGFYDHVEDEPDLDGNTIPETPKTLQIQLDQLADGQRRVVFIARGSKLKIEPKDYGARKVLLPPGEFIYDPKAINAKEIIAAVRNHELADILGSATSGYGTPNKHELDGPTAAVVARDEDGETAHSAMADHESIQSAIEAAGDLTPKGGTISVEAPDIEIGHRLAESAGEPPKKLGKKWLKPKGKVKLPAGETS